MIRKLSAAIAALFCLSTVAVGQVANPSVQRQGAAVPGQVAVWANQIQIKSQTVAQALGYTPVNKAGDTGIGNLGITGNVTASGTVQGGTVAATGAVNAASAAITGNLTATNVTASGTVQGATVTSTGAVNAASAAITGNLTATNVTASGTVQGGTVTATGAVNAASAAITGNLTATNVTASGAVNSASMSVSGLNGYMVANGASAATAQTAAQVGASVSPSVVIPGSLSGMTMANNGTTSLDVLAGTAASDDGLSRATLTGTLTKTLGSWAAGGGNGSLDTGTVAPNTWYHVAAIYNPTSGLTDILTSTSLTPVMPTGYTKKRRIGSIRTNASSQITPFVQTGDEFQWNTVFTDASNAALTASTPVLQTTTVPLGIKVKAHTRFYCATTGGVTFFAISPDETATNSYSGNGNFVMLTPAAANVDIITDTSARVKVLVNAAANYYENTYGWVDTRGK